MTLIGEIIIYVIMICAVIGCLGAIRDEQNSIGREFMTAFSQLGTIFIPFAGMLAAMPYIEKAVLWLFGSIFHMLGADVAIAGALIVAPDMGGYQLTRELSLTTEAWMMAIFVSYCTGPIISYSIPIGFSVISKKDRKYFGLGVMAGILGIPFAVLTMTLLLKWTETPVRDVISNTCASNTTLTFSYSQIAINMLPIVLFCIVLALCLRFFMQTMLRGFLRFGRFLEIAIKLILVASIVEYFTGFFSHLFPSWAFSPIIADAKDQFRALENAGYLVLMLSGAYPMIYLIDKYFGSALNRLGQRCGFSEMGSVGLFATLAEQLAMFGLVKRMRAEDKVKVIAFSTCGSWLLGAHISVTANFQPNLLAIILIGKLVGAIVAVLFALWLAVPMAKKIEIEESRFKST